MTLNKSLAFAGILFSVASSAIAGDFAAPAAIGPVNWTGFYAGLQGGLASGKGYATETDDLNFFTVTPGDRSRFAPSGVFGGGQIGYQRQRGNFVYGVEASLVGADIRHHISLYDDAVSERMSLTSVHTVVGRLGYVRDNVLAYIKAGYAGGTTKFRADCPPCSDTPAAIDLDHGTYHGGYALGGGLEWRIRPNWTLGIDYTRVDLRAKEASGTITLGGVPTELISTFNSRAQADFVGVRLNYQLDFAADHSAAVPLK